MGVVDRRLSGLARDVIFGIGYTDAAGHFIHADSVYAEILKRQRAEIVGLHYLDVTSPNSAGLYDALFRNLIRTGSPIALRAEYIRPDQVEVPVSVNLSVIRDGDGLARGAISICQPLLLEAKPTGSEPHPSTISAVLSAPPTGGQVRAARGWLGWSVRELSEASGVSSATINRFEDESTQISVRASTVGALQKTLEASGMTFFNDLYGNPAVTRKGPATSGGESSGRRKSSKAARPAGAS